MNGKMKVVNSYVSAFRKWLEEGKGPKTRDEAILIISHEIEENLAVVKRKALDVTDDDGNFVTIDERLSLMVWDLTVNGRRMFDYDLHRNYLTGLLSQATHFLYTYPREILKVAGETISVPKLVNVSGRGLVELRKEGIASIEAIAEAFIRDAARQMTRWQAIGADASFVRRTLNRLETRVLAQYEKAA